MNPYQNWNPDTDANGSYYGSQGFYSMSAAFMPCTIARVLRRLIFAALMIAGFCGAAFQALQSAHTVTRIVSSPHVQTQQHHHRKDHSR